MTDLLLRMYVFVVGASIGSFLNVCAGRWPAGLSVVSPRSRCPGCGHRISWFENIPLISWIALRGRCRGCGQRISVQYPLAELCVGLLWLASTVEFGFTFTALRVAVFATILLGVALTDAAHYVIPDGFTASGLLFAIFAAIVGTFTNETLPFAGLYDALIGACVGAGAIAITGWLGELAFKKEAMGFGDVTLMAMVGAHVGPTRALMTVFLAALIGAAVFLLVVYPIAWVRGRGSGEPTEMPLVPFGVFLAPGALVALLWGNAIIAWYVERVLGM
ncbi:MAG: A24 family peptidase [Gemmatimonadaceae bacterium]